VGPRVVRVYLDRLVMEPRRPTVQLCLEAVSRSRLGVCRLSRLAHRLALMGQRASLPLARPLLSRPGINDDLQIVHTCSYSQQVGPQSEELWV
jgi:hypothetical protein